jgi:hypothetical protein
MSETCARCGGRAVIRVIALDRQKGVTEAEATMLLCYEHFWEWNAHSLNRRGLHTLAAEIRGAIETGALLESPPTRFGGRSS